MNCFVADAPGPPRRRLYIYDGPVPAPGRTTGWSFVVDEYDANGEPQPHFDTWEEHFFEILRYLPKHDAGGLVWRREETDEIVDLGSLKFGSYDAQGS